MFHYAEKSRFLLARSCAEENKHVLTGFPFPPYYLFNPPLCVLSLSFFFRKEKACHSLTGYIIVKFMLFCNLETSYSMAHLIKHLKQNCMVPDFYGGL